MFVEQENNIFFEIENIYTIIMEKIAILGLQTLHLKIAMPPQLFGNMLVLNYLNYTLCIARWLNSHFNKLKEKSTRKKYF